MTTSQAQKLTALSISLLALSACAMDDVDVPADDDPVEVVDDSDGGDVEARIAKTIGELPGTPLWPVAGKTSGDFETEDFSQWNKVAEVSDDRIRLDDSPRAQGAYSARFEVRYGDDPINSTGNRAELTLHAWEREGDERWYQWSTKFANGFPHTEEDSIFTQFHPNVSKATPGIAFATKKYEETDATKPPRTEIRMVTSTGVAGVIGTKQWGEELVRERWYTFRLHVKWSADPTVGFVELWVNGKNVVEKTHVQTLVRGSTGTYIKQGIYPRTPTMRPRSCGTTPSVVTLCSDRTGNSRSHHAGDN